MPLIVLTLAGVVGLVGCRKDVNLADGPLKTFTWVDDQTALQVLADRAASVKTVQSECGLRLVRDGGDSVNLDGAVVLQPPDLARLKAWKFGQAVFDLTIRPDGVWMLVPDKSRRDQIMPASAGAAKFIRQWSWFMGQFFVEKDRLTVRHESGSRLVVSRPNPDDGTTVTCEVDRATLTARKYILTDSNGKPRFTLDLAAYQEINGIAWPTFMKAHGESSGTIEVSLRNPEINAEVAPHAFDPPRRAEKLP